MFLCTLGIFRNYFKFEVRRAKEKDMKGHPAVGTWVWPPIGKEPETPPDESALRIAPV